MNARSSRWHALACALLLADAGAAHAQAAEHAAALRTGVFASDDADDTTVLETTAGVVFDWIDIDHYRGLVVEDVRIRPAGGARYDEQRVFVTAAGGDALKWKVHIGSDGDAALGNASAVHEGRVRQEYFIERDLLETRQGAKACITPSSAAPGTLHSVAAIGIGSLLSSARRSSAAKTCARTCARVTSPSCAPTGPEPATPHPCVP
jgi:hypothetical protein